ncbi:glycosyltransferase [Mycobacterium spongiae]|uniref:glycosyltransferase n=1 Tax=Mycobacterium spongiae TaxID=886343 RepID=UPI001FE36237|nr:glycosyltransferase [Mycobacterium spongiae]
MSIVSTAYNQETYVRQTYDSFVAQQTDFPVEIIVADDASTDSTPAIIREYTDRYPQLFRPIFRPENLGLNANLIGAMSTARGEYLALCEGDDYWIDPLKLSKQVAFLDRHPEAAVCFHPVWVVWDDGRADDVVYPPLEWHYDFSVEALIERAFIQTNSVMYRRLPRYDDIPADIMPLDYYLHLRHAVRGDVAMLPETMAVYRRHAEGMWYDALMNPSKFWLAQGAAHAATFDAVIDLIIGNPAREHVVGKMCDWVLGEIAKVPGTEGRAALLDCIARHPRLAMLALQYQRTDTPWRQFKGRLSNRMWKARANMDVYSARLKNQTTKARRSPTPIGEAR